MWYWFYSYNKWKIKESLGIAPGNQEARWGWAMCRWKIFLYWDPMRTCGGIYIETENKWCWKYKTMGCPSKGAVGASESRGAGLDSTILEFRRVHRELQAPSINTRVSAFSTGFQSFLGPVFVALPLLLVLERVKLTLCHFMSKVNP